MYLELSCAPSFFVCMTSMCVQVCAHVRACALVSDHAGMPMQALLLFRFPTKASTPCAASCAPSHEYVFVFVCERARPPAWPGCQEPLLLPLRPQNCWSITLAQPATTHAAPAPTPSPSQPPAAARGPEAGFAGPGHGGHDEEGAQQPPDCSTSSDVGCSSSTACCQARPGCGPQPSPSMLQQQPPCPTKDGEPSGTCSGSSAHGAATRADDGQDASSGSSCAGALARPQEGAQPPSSTTLTVAGYSWQALPDASIPASGEQEGEVTPAARPLFVWVGPQASPSLQALQLALSTQDWLRYTPPPVPAGGSTLQGDEGDSAAASGSGGSAGGADGGGDGVGQGSCQGVTEVGLSPGTHALLKRRCVRACVHA